ncbi:MAG: cyclic nucleotide-binding domain-containing protein [Thermodesulfobacteriota bacterium]|nr:cyclic nucleotide-binding domain-containing protein [Thermodesulfobacteriota bacterium]
MEPSEIIDVLENCDIFKGLAGAEIERIATLGYMETYETGENIFTQGESGENLYIIAEGHVFLERDIDLGTRKGNAIIGLLGKGRALGCWSALIGDSHAVLSSARCRRPTKVFVVNGQSLREMMLDDVKLGFNILERLCYLLKDRIQGAYGAMENI